MKIDLLLAIARKHFSCPECGNTYIGDTQGTLEVDDTTYKRTCKCGWTHEEVIEEEGI